MYNDEIYVFGGFVLQTTPRLNTLIKLNIDSGISEYIETKGEIPSIRSGHSVVKWQNFMFVFGGWNDLISKNVSKIFFNFLGYVQI